MYTPYPHGSLLIVVIVVARKILAGHNWRNLPVLVALGPLFLANAMVHAGAFGEAGWSAAGKRPGIAVVVMLIALIGGADHSEIHRELVETEEVR